MREPSSIDSIHVPIYCRVSRLTDIWHYELRSTQALKKMLSLYPENRPSALDLITQPMFKLALQAGSLHPQALAHIACAHTGPTSLSSQL